MVDFFDEPQDIDYVIVKTKLKTVCERGSIYEATRYAWVVSGMRIQKYEYVLGVIDGIVRGVYHVDEWREIKSGRDIGRYEFLGTDAPYEIAEIFLNKRLPPKYCTGSANPVLYKK